MPAHAITYRMTPPTPRGCHADDIGIEPKGGIVTSIPSPCLGPVGTMGSPRYSGGFAAAAAKSSGDRGTLDTRTSSSSPG